MMSSDFAETFINLSCKTSGRDRICRLIQYSSKFVWWHLSEAKETPTELVNKLKNLDASISTARKLFRLGKSFEVLYGTLRTLHISDPVLRILVSFSRINQSLFLLFDNLIWADRVGLLKVERRKISDLSARFWLANIIFNLFRDFYLLWLTLVDEMRQQQIQSRYTKEDGPCQNETKFFRSQIEIFVKCLQNNRPIAMDIIRNSADLTLPLAMLRRVNVSQGTQGLVGVISSVIGILTEWNPIFKVVPS